MRLLTALAVALAVALTAARSSEGDVRDYAHEKIKTIIYTSSADVRSVDMTTICLEGEIPENAKISLVVTPSGEQEDHVGIRSDDTNCAVFATVAMPTDDGPVTYVMVYNAGTTEESAVSSMASFTFEASRNADTFTCEGRVIERTTGGGSDCLDASGVTGDLTSGNCYKDVTGQTASGGDTGDCTPVNDIYTNEEYDICQPSEGQDLVVETNVAIDSLEYETGQKAKFNLALGGNLLKDIVEEVLVIVSNDDEKVHVLAFTEETSSAELEGFTRGTDVYTVCPVGGNYYAEDSITDINIAATSEKIPADSGTDYYEFAFSYTDANQARFQAKSGNGDPVNVDCSHLGDTPPADTRCYGYVKNEGPLQVSYLVPDGLSGEKPTNTVIFAQTS